MYYKNIVTNNGLNQLHLQALQAVGYYYPVAIIKIQILLKNKTKIFFYLYLLATKTSTVVAVGCPSIAIAADYRNLEEKIIIEKFKVQLIITRIEIFNL